MIAVQDLTVRAGGFSLANVSFSIPAGDYGVLMGPTGTGKTTLLEAICGLREIVSGAITVAGRDVTRVAPRQRGIGYLPQDLALFPTMTVREHLAFALVIRKRPAEEIARRVDELAGLLGIASLLARRPFGLSGGERQRVALGRALAARPAVLLLDEPLSALDETLRGNTRQLLKDVQTGTRTTILHVTHSSSEAEALGDHHFRLENGVLSTVTRSVP